MFGLKKKNANELTFTVAGMSCPKCAARVENAAKAVAGVANAEVTLKKALLTVTVTPDAPATAETIAEAVTAAGYKTTVKA